MSHAMTVLPIKKCVFVSGILLFYVRHVLSYQFPNGNFQQEPVKSNRNDDPLILTPLIDQNKIEEAKQAARVNPDMFLGVESYSGFFTVNKEYNFHKSNMFFWFFPSENNYGNDPVILWLQGALNERSSSLFGLFMENGPFSVNSDHQLVPREYSWTKNHSVLYIDNPVGAGYSFTNDLYAKNQTEVGKDLYNALQQFFKLFSELRENDFFIIGESYAGKYIPAIGYTILKENLKAENKINLQGLAIGNGFSDPIHQIDYSDYLYQLGILDRNVRKSLKENENEVTELIKKEEYRMATEELPFYYYNDLGFYDLHNYLYPRQKSNLIIYYDLYDFLNRPAVRAAIHVGGSVFHKDDFASYLKSDITKSVAPWISELLSHYRMLFYNGQLDMLYAYPMMENFLYNLDFDASEQYKTAKRHLWFVDEELAGYVKKSGNLTEALVRAAGRLVFIDQPKWGYDLIYNFIRDQIPYNK